MKLESIGSSHLRADEIPVPFQMTALEAPLGVFVPTDRPGSMTGSTSCQADTRKTVAGFGTLGGNPTNRWLYSMTTMVEPVGAAVLLFAIQENVFHARR